MPSPSLAARRSNVLAKVRRGSGPRRRVKRRADWPARSGWPLPRGSWPEARPFFTTTPTPRSAAWRIRLSWERSSMWYSTISTSAQSRACRAPSTVLPDRPIARTSPRPLSSCKTATASVSFWIHRSRPSECEQEHVDRFGPQPHETALHAGPQALASKSRRRSGRRQTSRRPWSPARTRDVAGERNRPIRSSLRP